MGFAIPIGVIAVLGRIAAKTFTGRGNGLPASRVNPEVASARAILRRIGSERGDPSQEEQARARQILRDQPAFLPPPVPLPPPPAQTTDRAKQEEALNREQAETIAALALLDFPEAPPPVLTAPPFSEPSAPPRAGPIPLPPAVVGQPDVTVKTEEEPKVANGFELIPFLSGVANVFGAASELGSVIRGPVSAPAPVQVAGIAPIISSGVGAVAGTAVAGFLGFGNGNGTPLSRARDSSGRRVTRRQVITAARVCGIETAAQSFGLSVTELCTIVSKGMPRRSRGISSSDMRRTRSTLRKMATMRKTLKPLCR